jgi:hypothetical protein
LFDFIEPAFEVGLSVSGVSVEAAQSSWPPHLDGLAALLNGLMADWTVVVDSGDVARPRHQKLAGELDSAWLQTRSAFWVEAPTSVSPPGAMH